MTDNSNTQDQQQTPKPNPDLKSLDRLIGTWRQSGGVDGEVTYEWMEGGFFLIQRVDLEHDRHKIKGIEIIGHLQLFGDVAFPVPAGIIVFWAQNQSVFATAGRGL